MSSWLSFLASRGARLDAEGVVDFGDPRAEALAARDRAALADLSHNALIAVEGDDAAAFLQGQLTNDVESLISGAAQWSGWCTPKGRLLATFLLVREERRFLLMLPGEIAPAIAKRLGMFVLRSRVAISDASDSLVRTGFAGKTSGVLVARHFGFTPDAMRSIEKDGARCVALDGERFVILASPEVAPALWEKLAEETVPAGRDAWEGSLVRAGIPTVVAATQEAFVPQMVNFELVGGVSFRKGCYPGQEIVARAHYLGGVKRRMVLAHLAGEARPMPGEPVYSATFGEQAAGTVVQAAPAPEGGYDTLLVAQLDSLAQGDLHWKAPGGAAFELRRLPYAPEIAQPAPQG